MRQKLPKKWRKIILGLILVGAVIAVSLGTYTAIGIMRVAKEQANETESSELLYANYPKVNYGTGKQAQQIRKGEYLVKVGDCLACHTAPVRGAKPFAGNYPVKTPFGTIFTPNLTGDKETGLGQWTEADFVKSMREGIAKDGSYYYPAFPYPYFNKLRDEDLSAMWAYFKAIPKHHEVKKANTMVFPFNIRFLQLGWRTLFFTFNKTGPYKDDPKQTAAWNHGAYFVEGLGHCGMCHTPSYYIISKQYPLAAPRYRYRYSGGPVVGYYAPAINHKGLGPYPDEEILKVFKQDKMLGGGEVVGPMKEANHYSLSRMTNQDLLAMITYLKSIKSESLPVKTGGSKGEGIYEAHCAACHATGAGGAPKFADATAWKALLTLGQDKLVYNAIHGIKGMPAKGACPSCTDEDIKSAVIYMMDAVSGKTASAAPAAKPLKPLTLADGKRVYQQNCQICHANGFKNAPKPGDKKAWQPMIQQGFVTTYLHALHGYKAHPPRGACNSCSNAEIKAAVKYMMQQSTTSHDYRYW